MVSEVKQSPQQVIAQLEHQDRLILSWVEICRVTDPKSQANAENILISARSALKRANEKRRELLKPIEQAIDGVNNLFKPYLQRLQSAIDVCDRELRKYHADCVELAKFEQQSVLMKQAEAVVQARITGEVVELPPAEAVVAAPPKTGKAELGTVTYREEQEVTVVNPDLVPRDLCEPSLAKIKARVKSGIVDIPGVLVATKLVTVARRLTAERRY